MDKDLDQEAKAQCDLILKAYQENLMAKLSLPDLYLSERDMWRGIVIDGRTPAEMKNLRNFLWEDDEWMALYISYYQQWAELPPDPKRRDRDHFLYVLLDRTVNKIWYFGTFNWMETYRLAESLPLEHYTESYGVDRHTACMIKSLIDDHIIIELEWIKI